MGSHKKSLSGDGNVIVDLPGGLVWLTISDFNDADTVVHGVFMSKDYADRCASEVREIHPERDLYVGSWKINEAWSRL
jgi:hypothetical protein